MKKKNVTIIVKAVLFLALLICVTVFVGKILQRKDEYIRYKQFYSEKENFDVLFFGSSRALDCFQPMELWEDYGITSYNLAQHSEILGKNYWSMYNAFKYNTPKVAVVDISTFGGSTSVSSESSESDRAYMHNTLDHMPLSREKIEAVNALCSKDLRLEYLFPLILYHSRWNDLGNSDFYGNEPARKGAETRTTLAPAEFVPWPTDDLAEIFDPSSVNLDKIIALCKERNVQLICVCLPAPEGTYYTTMNSFSQYLEDNDVPFINLWDKEDIINYATDFADASHVNNSGSKKLTSVIGEYLSTNYSFSDKSDKEKASWNEALQRYKGSKTYEVVTGSADITSTLLRIMSDDDFKAEIVYKDKETIEAMGISELLKEMEGYSDIYEDFTLQCNVSLTVYFEGNEEPLVSQQY